MYYVYESMECDTPFAVCADMAGVQKAVDMMANPAGRRVVWINE